ncbi:hypothetical protein HanHA300_Chr09g0329781 [Helianthus annuus]|nr:hypothetical protein HanHA300_Chr09g0329781 [Helianthus annuus]
MTDHLCYSVKPTATNSYSDLEAPPYQLVNKPSPFQLPYVDFSTNGFLFSPTDTSQPRVLNLEDARKNCGSMNFGGEQQPLDDFSINHYRENELGNVLMGGFPFGLTSTIAVSDERRLTMAWDSPPSHSASTT